MRFLELFSELWKKMQIALKIKSPEWNRQTDRQTEWQTDRLTLNFINIDMIKQKSKTGDIQGKES